MPNGFLPLFIGIPEENYEKLKVHSYLACHALTSSVVDGRLLDTAKLESTFQRGRQNGQETWFVEESCVFC